MATPSRTENVHLHAEDREAEINAVPQDMKADQAQEYSKLMHSPGGQMYLLEQLINRRTLDRLVAIAQGNPLPPEVHDHHDHHEEHEDHEDTVATVTVDEEPEATVEALVAEAVVEAAA